MELFTLLQSLDKKTAYKIFDNHNVEVTAEEIKERELEWEEVSYIQVMIKDLRPLMIIGIDYEGVQVPRNWNVTLDVDCFKDVTIEATEDEINDNIIVLEKVIEALKNTTITLNRRDYTVDNIEKA